MERRYRIRNLAIAGALAVVAALLTSAWVSRAGGGAQAKALPTVPVLVATRDLPIGTSASAAYRDGWIAVRRLPAESTSPAAMTSPLGLRGQQVTQPIYKGEQVVADRFGRSGTQGLGASLSGALRAIQLPGDPNQVLAGTLQPGDHVDVVANVRLNAANPRSRVALRDLIVLRADSSGSSTSSTASAAVTLQLTDKQAQMLLWVTKNADWSLVLRPSSGATSTATKPTKQSDVLAGS